MFRKKYEMSLNRVHDTVSIREGDDRLVLRVDVDPMRITAGLVQARQMMQQWTDKTPKKQQKEYALFFAGVIFGEEQAKQLLDFYHGNPGCVVNVCGRYFSERLRGLIEKAQKKLQ